MIATQTASHDTGCMVFMRAAETQPRTWPSSTVGSAASSLLGLIIDVKRHQTILISLFRGRSLLFAMRGMSCAAPYNVDCFASKWVMINAWQSHGELERESSSGRKRERQNCPVRAPRDQLPSVDAAVPTRTSHVPSMTRTKKAATQQPLSEAIDDVAVGESHQQT